MGGGLGGRLRLLPVLLVLVLVELPAVWWWLVVLVVQAVLQVVLQAVRLVLVPPLLLLMLLLAVPSLVLLLPPPTRPPQALLPASRGPHRLPSACPQPPLLHCCTQRLPHHRLRCSHPLLPLVPAPAAARSAAPPPTHPPSQAPCPGSSWPAQGVPRALQAGRWPAGLAAGHCS